MAPEHVSSPGNRYSTGELPMRMPHLEFIYRIAALMDPGSTSIPNVHNTGLSRLILPIAGGTVRGPRIKGDIVQNSGADWAQLTSASKFSTLLNARYTLKTNDEHYILVNAVGKASSGPDNKLPPRPSRDAPVTMTQDDVEYFTHVTFEAPGDSPYDWMNSVVAIGVMTMVEGKPIIDCYRLTNFPGRGTAHL